MLSCGSSANEIKILHIVSLFFSNSFEIDKRRQSLNRVTAFQAKAKRIIPWCVAVGTLFNGCKTICERWKAHRVRGWIEVDCIVA